MGDCESIIPDNEGERHVFAAAQHIVKALAASKNVNNDMRKLLSDLDSHLSNMTIFADSDAMQIIEVENRLKCAEEKVMKWQSNQSMIWELGPHQASEYLRAVDEVRKVTESLGSLPSNRNEKQRELFNKAHSFLQMEMARLEGELIHILSRNKQSFEPRYPSFRSSEENVVYQESTVSVEDESLEDTARRERSSTESEEYIIDLIHPDVIFDIKSIANLMFAANFGPEFCQSFISVRKDSLDEYLIILGVKKLSIEDVLKLEWESLCSRIKKWCRAMKVIIRFYLTSEKRIFDQVLGEFGSVSLTCLIDTSKASILCLLNFGEAIVIGPHQPEMLTYLLDMYEVVADLLPDIDVLFSAEVGSFVRNEFKELLTRLGDSARATFAKFGNRVASKASITPKGAVHPLVKYVMNHIKFLVEYDCTLNLLLEHDRENMELAVDPSGENISSYVFCPMAYHLRSLANILEASLNNKSNEYGDDSLKHIFMMNNIHYMVQKVKGSKLGTYFGDEWSKKQMGKVKKHATSYERATWNSLHLWLRDDGKTGKSVLKERYRRFCDSFEDVYKCQTGWLAPDPRLRDDLQISISKNITPAYRNFIGKFSDCIGDEHVKYTAEDLENYILHLFEGQQRSLRRP